MESFGINLQRKTTADKAMKIYHSMSDKYKQKDVPAKEISDDILSVCDNIKNLMSINCLERSELKNEHNILFLSLIDRIRYLKQKEIEREKL